MANTATKDIEERLSLDQKAAADWVLSLRKRWADRLYPALVNEVRSAGVQVRDHDHASQIMQQLSTYPWFSHMERAQQKMLWRLACDVVLENEPELLKQLDNVETPTKGSLTLNPELEYPKYYQDIDIHMQPGNFFSDELSGFIYQFGARIVMLRDNDGYKFHNLFAKTALPEIPDATRVLDMACGFGKSTRPLVNKYPTAEIIGMDLAAPGLRLAHMQAEAEGVAIHYKQGDAAYSGLEAASCDVVTGTMYLHEMPHEHIVATIKEAARLLKPGGSLHFLEFQPTGDPVRDATVYEHAERNNEPFFRALFAVDLVALCKDLGLEDAKWTPFDERNEGLLKGHWPQRNEWHFPWCVLSARRPA